MKWIAMKRLGFTLVELLVVVAIIGMLLALLLPAVQAAREAGRCASCQNNLRQIGLALHSFHDVHKVLPPSGWTTAGSGNPKGKFVGWRPLILPHVEEANLQRAYDFDLNWWEGANVSVGVTPLAVFRCPAVPERKEVTSAVAKPPRPAMTFPGSLAPTDYEAIIGVHASVDPTRYATQATNRSAMYRNSSVKMTQIIDGTAETVLLVECAARPLIYRGRQMRADLANDQGQGWIDSEGPFSLDGSNENGSLQGQGTTTTPWAMNATNENEPYSFHPAGGNTLFADGHVQFIAEAIPLEVFAAMCTRTGREVVVIDDP
jgi:prepilin-type N-terminal cleavage/methylation domain-containing protein/prepilin-type processing-associated H-X9-DG protein